MKARRAIEQCVNAGGIEFDAVGHQNGTVPPAQREDTSYEAQVRFSGGQQGNPFLTSSGRKSACEPGAFMMSYPKWCAMLVPMVFKSRTPFSKSIHLLRGPFVMKASTPTFFPVPVFDKGQLTGCLQMLLRPSGRRLICSVLCMLFAWPSTSGIQGADGFQRRT